jgi:hypothetical protein
VSSGFTDRENGISQPAHAQIAELLIEELNAQLTGEERDVLDNRKSYSPLLILGELYNCGKK